MSQTGKLSPGLVLESRTMLQRDRAQQTILDSRPTGLHVRGPPFENTVRTPLIKAPLKIVQNQRSSEPYGRQPRFMNPSKQKTNVLLQSCFNFLVGYIAS